MQMATHLAGIPTRVARLTWDAPAEQDFRDAIKATPIRVPNQFDPSLSPGEAYAACGPAAAIAFAQAAGRNPTLREAVDLAKTVGWTPENGMAGPASEQKLLHALGVSANLSQGVDWGAIQAEVATGNPVIIDTPKHYFVATAFDPQTGKFNFQASGTAVGGKEWMTPQEVASISQPRATLTMDSPSSGLSSPSAGPSPLGTPGFTPVEAVGQHTWNQGAPPKGVVDGGSKTLNSVDFNDWLGQSGGRVQQAYDSMSV